LFVSHRKKDVFDAFAGVQMKYRRRSFLISVFFHILILVFIVFIPRNPVKRSGHFILEIQPDSPAPIREQSPKNPVRRRKQPDIRSISWPLLVTDTLKYITVQADTFNSLPTDLQTYLNDKEKKENLFLEKDRFLPSGDSAMQMVLSYPRENTGNTDFGANPVRSGNYQGSGLPMLNIAESIAESIQNKSESHPVRFDFVPSETQIAVMKALYETGKANQVDLYSGSRSSRPITAEMFNEELTFLVRKGFISRRKISPEHLFIFFVAPIEMSAKNRRNPVYLYKAKVDQDQLVNYLQALRFQYMEQLESADRDSLRIRTRIREIDSLLQLLFR